MSSLVVVNLLFVVVGLGLLPWLGLVRDRRGLLRFGAVGYLTGMAAVGIAATSLAFLEIPFGWPSLAGFAAACGGAGWLRLRRPKARTLPVGESAMDCAPPDVELGVGIGALAMRRAVGAATLVVLVGLALLALRAYRVKPLEEYDGWAMWGMKARALQAFGSATPDVFASAAYKPLHLEYPVLVPAIDALPLDVAGAFSSNLVVLQSLLFGVAGILAIWALLRDRVPLVILGPMLVAIATAPAVLRQLGSGYADMPLAFFVAAGVVSAARWLLDGRPAWLACATLFLSASALAKNEGTLFALCAVGCLFAITTERRSQVLLAGALIVAATIPWRAFVAIHSLSGDDYDLSSSFDVGWVAGRAGRAPRALQALLEYATDPRLYGLLFPLAVGAMAACFFLGSRPLGVFAAGFTAFSLLGLSWIYLISRAGLGEYLDANGNRVVAAIVLGGAALTPLLIAETLRGADEAQPQRGP